MEEGKWDNKDVITMMMGGRLNKKIDIGSFVEGERKSMKFEEKMLFWG